MNLTQSGQSEKETDLAGRAARLDDQMIDRGLPEALELIRDEPSEIVAVALTGLSPAVAVKVLGALPEVLQAVDGRIEVLMDGGIRRGGDIVKAICLGAKAVLVGRAYAWALGAAGGPGVARAIEILRTDVIRTMRLLGCPSVSKLDASYIDAPRQGTHVR